MYGKKSYKIPEFTEASNCVSTVPGNYSDNHLSGDVKVTLEPAEGGYILTYHMDEEWVRSPERQWPLTLDPVVMTAQLAKNIKDQYVAMAGIRETVPG